MASFALLSCHLPLKAMRTSKEYQFLMSVIKTAITKILKPGRIDERTRRSIVFASSFSSCLATLWAVSTLQSVRIISRLAIGLILFAFKGSLGPVYGVDSDLRMTKSESSTSISLFWLLFAFFRIPYMVLVAMIGETTMLTVINGVFIGSTFILIPFAPVSKVAYLVGLTVLGIGESPIYPASLGYLQKYVRVSGAMASCFMIAICIGKFTYPSLISFFFKAHPNSFIYIVSICTIVVGSCLYTLQFICWKYSPKRNSLMGKKDGILAINEMVEKN